MIMLVSFPFSRVNVEEPRSGAEIAGVAEMPEVAEVAEVADAEIARRLEN
jgi:hypothetical protein